MMDRNGTLVRPGPHMKKVRPSRLALVIDTETTGLIDNRSIALDKLPEVIEFCGLLVDLKDGKIKDELDVLIRPSRELGVAIGGMGRVKKTTTQITGITSEMLEKMSPFGTVASTIANFIESAPLVIAQNASFDKEMLDVEYERIGITIKWPPILCTVEQTIHLKGKRLNLAALHELLLGEGFPGAHRARADVEALVRCCVELYRRGDI